MVLAGLAIALVISVTAAGQAGATGCSTIQNDIAFHNAKQVNKRDAAAVAAYNREADMLEAVARSCGYKVNSH
ncbi:hypothetical protein A9W95_11085 [Mycobacterium sp. 1423905.2]|nr:hypothetical protein A9W95_11085 [Mycobacterium sp. 1423905.2]